MNKTGATRYQKFLKKEKAKTKLKAKKDLPKGTNVTKTNFKVKKIVIKEQLKKHGEAEQLSSRKLNAKELLSRLNHFNKNSRTDALEGITELITLYPANLEQNLGQFILNVTPLILNVEKVVRLDTLKVLQLILSRVPPVKIEPFFDIISTYLRSAMTHIDSRIQEDSLLFLDVLLLCTPEKIAENFHKIVPNFLDMISKLRVDAKPGRNLTVNLNSKISSVKWRNKVIHRLHDFLSKYAEYHQIYDNSQHTRNETKVFDVNKINNFPLFNTTDITICYLSNVSKNTQNLQEGVVVEKFKAYVETLIPLLFETWLEVCPNNHTDRRVETFITEDAAVLLRHTLKVISLLCKLIKFLDSKNSNFNLGNDIFQKYILSFCQHFVTSFPYVTNIKSKHGKNVDPPFEGLITDPKLIAENLEICHLYITFNPNVDLNKQNVDVTSVLNYIESIFSNNSSDNICNIVLDILYTLFSKEVTGWNRTLTALDNLLNKIIQIYFEDNIEETFKHKIFAFLCQLSLNEKLSHFHTSDAYAMWLKNIPNILMGKCLTMQTVDILHKFATRNNATFNSVIKPRLENIIENLPNLTISDSMGSCDYHKLFSLFYWIKCWGTESLNLLENQLMNNVHKNNYGKYIFDTLRLRSGGIL